MISRTPDGYYAPSYNMPHVDNWGEFKRMAALVNAGPKAIHPDRAIDSIVGMMDYMTSTGRHQPDAWQKQTIGEHLQHACDHIAAYKAFDTQEDHLQHAACRLLMALDQRLTIDLPEPSVETDHVKPDLSIFDGDE